MQKFVPGAALHTVLAQMQQETQRVRPAYAPGVMVNRTTRGVSYRPTAKTSRRNSTPTKTVARWA